MTALWWSETVRVVHERARLTCKYCQTAQRVMGQAMHVEHIDPDGGNDLDNLCLSCPSCNLSKASAITAVDPITQQIVMLFNPRFHRCQEHFEWEEGWTQIAGLTSVGRAAVARLKMNLPRHVEARAIWVLANAHPPK